MNRILGAAVMLGFLITALAGPVAAADRRVRIINETGFSIVSFHGSNEGADSWEEDILGQEVLAPGASVVIDFADGSDHCVFDFLAVFSDGDEMVRNGVNVCETSSFRYH